MDKKQTAVELLEEKLKISFGNDMKPLRGFFVIAKEMEKEQIMKAHISAGARLEDISIEAAEHYYNETYEGGNK